MTNRTGKKSQRPFLYRSLSSYLKEIFGEAVRKVPVDPGYGCPNRDGTIGGVDGQEGCAFCNLESFVPAHARTGTDPLQQVAEARKGKAGEAFIVYLQAGTGTYTAPDTFRQLVDRLCSLPDVVGFFIGTRPDRVDEKILEALSPWIYRKLVWLELGLQSAHDETLSFVNRGHDVLSFTRARELAREFGVPVLAHIILGLPGESPQDMIATADELARLGIDSVKLHNLHAVRDTPLADMVQRGEVNLPEVHEYVARAVDFLERLPPTCVIDRLSGDAPREYLVAPQWCLDKGDVRRRIEAEFVRRGTSQGAKYEDGGED